MDNSVKVFTKEQIAKLAEPELRRLVLLPLLPKLGYDDAMLFHGPNERGKDLVGSRVDREGKLRTVAVVAKAKEVKGSQVYKEVGGQVTDALGSKVRSSSGNDERMITDVYVVTNKSFAAEARDKILAQAGTRTDPLRHLHVHFYDIEWIWAEWRKYFPVSGLNFLSYGYETLIEQGLPPGSRISVSSLGRETEFRLERFGLDPVDGLPFNAHFTVPNDDAGRELIDLIEKAITQGREVKVPGEYVKLMAPPGMEWMFGGPDADLTGGVLTISHADAEVSIPARINLFCDDGDFVRIDDIWWKVLSRGDGEVAFNNEQQNIPISAYLVVRPQDHAANITFTFAEGPASARWLKSWADIHRCFPKPGFTEILLSDTGTRLLWSRREQRESQEVMDWDAYRRIAELAVLEELIGHPIPIPVVLTSEHVNVLNQLQSVVKRPMLEGTWNGEIEVKGTPRQLSENESIARLVSQGPGPFPFVKEEIVHLGNSPIPLGRLAATLDSARIRNLDEVESIVAAGDDDSTSISVFISAGENNRVSGAYIDILEAIGARDQGIPTPSEESPE